MSILTEFDIIKLTKIVNLINSFFFLYVDFCINSDPLSIISVYYNIINNMKDINLIPNFKDNGVRSVTYLILILLLQTLSILYFI